MSLSGVQKGNIIEEYRLDDSDTGSPEVQVALLSARISELTEHFNTHKKKDDLADAFLQGLWFIKNN